MVVTLHGGTREPIAKEQLSCPQLRRIPESGDGYVDAGFTPVKLCLQGRAGLESESGFVLKEP